MITRTLNRRQALAALISLALVSCRGGRRVLNPVCFENSEWSDPKTPLTIDVHSHIFNGSDLPVKEFVARVGGAQIGSGWKRVAELLGGILQDISWDAAPDAKTEMSRLAELNSVFKKCDKTITASALDDRSSRYEAAVRELKSGARRHLAKRPAKARAGNLEEFMATAPPLSDVGARMILDLDDSYAAHQSSAPRTALFRKDFSSIVDFVLEMFQFRYTSFVRYMDDYSRGPTRRVDFVASALVDYDWWLCGSSDCVKTPLDQQMQVMMQLAIVTQGRVHAYAPFCPLREAIHRADPKATWSSLEFVHRAVTEQGAIGIKLYPPMGFAPYGNAAVQEKDPTFWKRAPWLPALAQQENFGQLLDAALSDLYQWCAKEGVAVLAHANASNGAFPEFESLALADHWDPALKKFPRLHVDFGHFGGPGLNAPDFLKRLNSKFGVAGGAAFVDASYFNGLLDDQPALKAQLKGLFALDEEHLHILASRLLYGTDWKMLLMEDGAGEYLTYFEGLMDWLATAASMPVTKPSFQDKFFGINAAMFLGLRKGDPMRSRLDSFYSKNGITKKPLWAEKVDAL